MREGQSEHRRKLSWSNNLHTFGEKNGKLQTLNNSNEIKRNKAKYKQEKFLY